MSFSRTAVGLKSRLHISHIPNSAIAGGAALLLLALGGVAFSYSSCSHVSDARMEVVAANGDASPCDTLSAPEEECSDDASVEGADGASGRPSPDSSPVVVAVYVSGAVVSPGVYRVDEGSRVEDAVLAAGGLASDAAPGSVNLARKVVDGEQIVVLTQDEAPSAVPAAEASSGSGAQARSGPVNINTADVAALDALPGVGPATAQAIVDERNANGAFSSVEDIQRVSGIGGKKFEKLKGSICV